MVEANKSTTKKLIRFLIAGTMVDATGFSPGSECSGRSGHPQLVPRAVWPVLLCATMLGRGFYICVFQMAGLPGPSDRNPYQASIWRG